jgi:glycosyltransferase involved in cell wall biosynthesis
MLPTAEFETCKDPEPRLPRLLYLGDVPVTATLAGAALIYRLLQKYPASQLRIVESDLWSTLRQWGHGEQQKRLPGIVYDRLHVGTERLLRSRAAILYAPYLHLSAPLRSRKLGKLVNEYQPEGILTVAHGYTWITAATLAKRHQIPLHLIVHDDWPTCHHLPHSFHGFVDKQFGEIYRQARTRLCISPYMVETYEQRYGVKGTVLYPSRAADANDFGRPSPTSETRCTSPVFAYAGSINSGGYAQRLISLARVLEPLNGRLVVYSSLSESAADSLGLKRSNIFIRPFIPSQELIPELRETANALFVPMDFDEHSSAMEISFPSKLTDFTATGLPLLICGPPSCSAVRWARENPGVAEIVEDLSIEHLAWAVARLVDNPPRRFELGANALEKGRTYFSHEGVTRKFYEAITQTIELPSAQCDLRTQTV